MVKKRFFNDHFSFTKRQRKGIYLLIAIVILLWILIVLIPNLVKEEKSLEDEGFKQNVSEFLENKKYAGEQKIDSPGLFFFDPNKIGEEDLQKLGLKIGVIRTLLNYRKAGGVFSEKEDLKKIYGLEEATFQELSPYILIEKQTTGYRTGKEPAPNKNVFTREPALEKTAFSLDINLADSLEWIKLRGIGPARTSGILRYRNALGGFHDIRQLSEVWNLPDSIFRNIKEQLVLTDYPVKRININTATLKELNGHPYISYPLAKTIKSYRETHGPFDSIQELKNLQLVNEQFYRKLVFYIKVK